jgi:hypothetical protein
VIGETFTLQMLVSTDDTFDELLASLEVPKDWGELEITFNSCGAALANQTGFRSALESGNRTTLYFSVSLFAFRPEAEIKWHGNA